MQTPPLKYGMYLEIEPERLTFTGNIADDINMICDDLRQKLSAAVDECRVDAAGVSSEYGRIIFSDKQDGAFIALDLYAMRPETETERQERLEKERKIQLKKEATRLRARTKDLEMIRKLATKHNLPLEIRTEPTPVQESKT